MQALESLFKKGNQSEQIQEEIQPDQADSKSDEGKIILPVIKIIDKETHPLRFREGFGKYAYDWNGYASSVRLPFQEKALEKFLKLSSFFSRRIESGYMQGERELNIKSLEDERSEVLLNGKAQSENQKKKRRIKKLKKEIGRRKSFLNDSIYMEEISFQRSKKEYLKSKAELKRADENFATNLDTDRLVFYCYCNSIADQEEINRLVVMLGSKRNLGRYDFLDLNLQLPRSLSSSGDLEERFRKAKELTKIQMEMINSV